MPAETNSTHAQAADRLGVAATILTTAFHEQHHSIGWY